MRHAAWVWWITEGWKTGISWEEVENLVRQLACQSS